MTSDAYDLGADLLARIDGLRARRDALDRELDAAMADLETRNEGIGAMLRVYKLKTEMARETGRSDRHDPRH